MQLRSVIHVKEVGVKQALIDVQFAMLISISILLKISTNVYNVQMVIFPYQDL